MRITRWILGVIGGLVLLLVAAVVVATLAVDPNRYRGQIAQIVRDLTGRPFEIRGDLKITWFPWLGVRTGPAYLGNLPGIAGPPLVEWDSAGVGVKLVPLIHGQFVVDRVRLQGPRLHLRRGEDGRGNWEALLARPRKSSAGGQAATEVAGIEVRDGTLDYEDEKSGLRVSLSNWHLDVGAWRAGSSLPVRTQFVLHGGPLPPAGVPVELEASRVTVQGSPLSVAVPKLSLRVADARVDGAMTLEQTGNRLRAIGPLSAQVPSIRQLATILGIGMPLPRSREAFGRLELTTTLAFTDGAIAMKPLAARLDDTKFAGWLARSNDAEPVWTFELHGDRIDLDRYINGEQKAKKKPFELPVEVLKALRAEGTLEFDGARLSGAQMKDVRLRLQEADRRVGAGGRARSADRQAGASATGGPTRQVAP